MSMMVSFVLSFFPRDVLDEILNLIESVSEDFPSYSCSLNKMIKHQTFKLSKLGNWETSHLMQINRKQRDLLLWNIFLF